MRQIGDYLEGFRTLVVGQRYEAPNESYLPEYAPNSEFLITRISESGKYVELTSLPSKAKFWGRVNYVISDKRLPSLYSEKLGYKHYHFGWFEEYHRIVSPDAKCKWW